MRICLIAEGSYPYVTGGVSSWIQSLMNAMPEHEFIIYAIGAERKQQGKFKYEIPNNVIEVCEFFLDDHISEVAKWGKRYRLNKIQKSSLISLVDGSNNVDWQSLFLLIRSNKFTNVAEFLSSKDYYELVTYLAKTKYQQVPFTELFWTISSMILPLFTLIRNSIPKADIYHSVSTGYAGIVGALAKVIYNKPLVLTEHGIYSREREEEIIKSNWVKGYFKNLWINYFYTLSSSIYLLADKIITLFERNKEIQIELGCESNKITIIPNGIDVNQYKQIKSTHHDNTIRIGAIVRVVPIKNIKMMIQAFALVEKKIPNVELFIMGPIEENESYFEECIELVKILGIKGITFTGMVNIKEYLGDLDFLLLSSISEGQPLAILEGFACSKPFISTNVGSCRELIEGKSDDVFGPAGYVVPVMHYEEMANYIIKLCLDESLRLEMGENGFNRVSKNYTREFFIASYKEIYNELGR